MQLRANLDISLCSCCLYPIKTKTQKVGNKLGKFTFFIIIVFHYSLARQCLWSLPGEVLLKSLPQNAKPVHVSPTGLFCLKGGYIACTIPWINHSTDSWESQILLSDKREVWLIGYYSKDLYSPSIHQSWLPHLITLRSWKQQGVWTIQRFILFFYFLLLKVILYPWMLYYAVDMSAGICWLTWLSCWLILTIISNEAWSTCSLDSRRPICWHIYMYI